LENLREYKPVGLLLSLVVERASAQLDPSLQLGRRYLPKPQIRHGTPGLTLREGVKL